MISLQNDPTFITITQGIIVITTKPEIEKYSLIKQFEQPGPIWNALNNHVKDINSIKQFRKNSNIH